MTKLSGSAHDRNHDSGPVHEISNNVVCATSKASDQPAHTFVKMSNCWKSHAAAHVIYSMLLYLAGPWFHCSFIAQSLTMVSRFLDVTVE